ncbi:hypothetical protein AB3M93_01625 [Novosphingobium panipatense]|jgi:hypothetical protein|uniref:hypothetical protein n=1 Tax=Novosphingobium TaxID=165696 RepID=UPI000CDACA3F|nr:hypothetical protein [Novosphingobium sp. HII-3]
MRPIPSLAATLAALALTVPATAQEPTARTTAQTVDAPASSRPEPGNPEEKRRILNAQQAEAAQRQVAANSASEAQHEAAVALNEMKVRRDTQAYANTLQAHDEAVGAYRASRDQWEVRTKACWDGDAVKCPPEPAVPGTTR